VNTELKKVNQVKVPERPEEADPGLKKQK